MIPGKVALRRMIRFYTVVCEVQLAAAGAAVVAEQDSMHVRQRSQNYRNRKRENNRKVMKHRFADRLAGRQAGWIRQARAGRLGAGRLGAGRLGVRGGLRLSSLKPPEDGCNLREHEGYPPTLKNYKIQ